MMILMQMPAVTIISSNHWSTDQQILDAMDWLQINAPADYLKIVADFPEFVDAKFEGSWFDHEAMGVDPEWSSWLADAIEATEHVWWEEGEPWALEIQHP